MGKEVRLFKSESHRSRDAVATFLRDLAERVDQGAVSLSGSGQRLQLSIPSALTLEIQAEDEDKGSRGTQHSLEIELKWFDTPPADAAGDDTLRLD